jgi:hypothetical protein
VVIFRRYGRNSTAIVSHEDGDPDALERWFAEDGDARTDPTVAKAILEFVRRYGAMSVVMTDRIIGGPHERGNRLSGWGGVPAMPILGAWRPLDGRGH